MVRFLVFRVLFCAANVLFGPACARFGMTCVRFGMTCARSAGLVRTSLLENWGIAVSAVGGGWAKPWKHAVLCGRGWWLEVECPGSLEGEVRTRRLECALVG